MEDRYGILISNKEVFVSVADFAQRFSSSSLPDIRDNSFILIEFIKELYMNYPLRGQSASVLSSTLDELDFYSLQNSDIQKLHRSTNSLHTPPQNKEAAQPNTTEAAKVHQALEEDKTATKRSSHSTNSRELESSKSVHLAYKEDAIISVVESPYLSSRIIVRDVTGRHAWLVTQHRALEYDCLENTDYNDAASVYKNALEIKGDQKLKESTKAKKTVSDMLMEEEAESEIEAALKTSEGATKCEEEYAKEVSSSRENNILVRALNFVRELTPSTQKVFTAYNK